MILVKNLHLRYIREYYALSNIDLKIEKGEKVAFLGAEGSGKTTLLRVLAKLEKPTSGEVYIKNLPLEKVCFKTHLSVGYLPVLPIYLKKKTVFENLAYILKQHKTPKLEIEGKIDKALEKFNALEHKHKKFNSLRLFDQYLVSLARLDLRQLDILLIDNVFERLNEAQVEKMLEIIKKLYFNNKNLTLIVATSSTHIADKIAQKKLYFKHGGLVETLKDEII